jgi:hypothetical protein
MFSNCFSCILSETVLSNVAIGLLAFQPRVQEFSGSRLDLESGYPDVGFPWFCPVPQATAYSLLILSNSLLTNDPAIQLLIAPSCHPFMIQRLTSFCFPFSSSLRLYMFVVLKFLIARVQPVLLRMFIALYVDLFARC